MGDLLLFPTDRAERRTATPVAPSPPAFYFDVGDPLSYLTAERVERTLGEVEWVVVDGSALGDGGRGGRRELRMLAEERARALRLPLVWPDPFPAHAPCALRATAFACELGAGPAFALAMSRLRFCGGFALDDPETIAEAAAAAAVPLGACLEAARETWRDDELRETARALSDLGIGALPAFSIAGRWLQGEAGLSSAGVLLHDGSVNARPLAPVG
jgi:2-hydroxychromene-2-carboxylate isomerase